MWPSNPSRKVIMTLAATIGLIALVAGTGRELQAADPVRGVLPSAEGEALVAAMEQARGRLRSGSYRAVGLKRQKSSSNAYEETIEVKHEFDIDRHLGRIEFERVHRHLVQRGGPPDAQNANRKQSAIIVDRPDMRIARHPASKTIELQPPGSLDNECIWDLRTIGWLKADEFDLAFLHYERMWKTLLSSKNLRITAGADPATGLRKLTFHFESDIDVSQREMWIDEKKDWAPVRLVTKTWLKAVSRDISVAPPQVYGEATVTWEMRNGAAVPTTAAMVARNIRPFGTAVSSETLLNLNIDWQSVNAELPESRFTEESVDQPSGRYTIVDARKRPPITLHHPSISAKRLQVYQNGLLNHPSEAASVLEPAGQGRLRWLIIGNLAVIALVVVFLYARWRIGRT